MDHILRDNTYSKFNFLGVFEDNIEGVLVLGKRRTILPVSLKINFFSIQL